MTTYPKMKKRTQFTVPRPDPLFAAPLLRQAATGSGQSLTGPVAGVIFGGDIEEGPAIKDCRLNDKENPESAATGPDSAIRIPQSAFGTPHSSAFSPDGVDLTLIRWMLSLSPRERLLAAQSAARSILRLRNAQSGS